MNILNFLQIFALLGSLFAQQSKCPNGIRIRKEIRDMTNAELEALKNAINVMRSTSTGNRTETIYDYIVKVHLDYVPIAHNTPQFLPWHRLYVLYVEDILRQIDPTVTIPYWDWGVDAARPLNSVVFSDKYFNIRPGPQGDCSFRVIYPRVHCVVRNYNANNFTTFINSETLQSIASDTEGDYGSFRETIEFIPHAVVHSGVGGVNGDMTSMMSPNDPIFWLHHSMIDKIWADWQEQTDNFWLYEGTHLGQTASLWNNLEPFKSNVWQSMDFDSLCYRYAPLSNRPQMLSHEELEDTPLPDRIPLSWIQMHGMDEEKFRNVENRIRSIMMAQKEGKEISREITGPKDNNEGAKLSSTLFYSITIALLAFIPAF
ncbi:Di-copper centre-containing protein [Rozella allomycis CSF55]|uniref:Di-copper centre-containing protein n=1 Tax=Rozella allomycis (strain CSF55) TaxID=988480 RepID=A0A4P9YI11_ROZAC|nr:Di-copper centre-containing protein [Rozella allomycis CSF55]